METPSSPAAAPDSTALLRRIPAAQLHTNQSLYALDSCALQRDRSEGRVRSAFDKNLPRLPRHCCHAYRGELRSRSAELGPRQ